MSIKRAMKLELCLAVLDGKVVKAYHPYQWDVVKEAKWEGRIMFEGEEEDSDLLDRVRYFTADKIPFAILEKYLYFSCVIY